MKKILFFVDNYKQNLNGVCQQLHYTCEALRSLRFEVKIISNYSFQLKHIKFPPYPEIELTSFPSSRDILNILADFNPDYIHIMTEGPIGISARNVCYKNRLNFTTSYHTEWRYYLKKYLMMPEYLSNRFVSWFHKKSKNVLVPTQNTQIYLSNLGIEKTAVWSGSVDLDLFQPTKRDMLDTLPRPIFTYVGRIAREKNIAAFLNLQLPGSKLIVGTGPILNELKKLYPPAVFLGHQSHAELPQIYSASDVVVFPSLTDTFGLTIVESLACGTPVAAFKTKAQQEILISNNIGIQSDDLKNACLEALNCDRDACVRYAENYSIDRVTRNFIDSLVEV